ncbi:histone deacetylase [Deinococcus irradiatisoli]|uniref:Histone deacetylase n=1 Tax=Deinococcus irradiatisoli TaxID=2202254 RepID=A0A2Z3JI23_9DEIO|nr:histone deacetylase [Deinococcus irradiatisoli]AWN22629.1 histone deacetylase [Deinococcus irradiatisoli]
MFRAFTAFGRPAYADTPPPRRQFLPREFLQALLMGAAERLPLLPAPDLPWALAERVHDPAYLDRWRRGEVTREEERALGFAWNPAVVARGLGSCGATLSATWDALSTGLGLNLGGGTHHAYADRAEGFSFLNDVAIAARHVLDAGLVSRVLVLDLDVHQGNGTASIFRQEGRVFTLSLHAARNYPFLKEQSDLDIELPDAAGDAEYLDALERALVAAAQFAPQLVFYLAGADVLSGDQLGRLAVSLDGLRARDERVYGWAAHTSTPLVSVMAGGYHRDPAQLVRARLQTLDAALGAFAPAPGTVY